MRGAVVWAAVLVLAGGTGLEAMEARAKAAPSKTRHASVPEIPAMKVSIVRSARPGCEPDCPRWIAAEGPIGEGSAERFRTVLASLGQARLPVVIHSPGGSVEQAFTIGRMIRRAGLTVVVGQTSLKPCRTGKAATCAAGTAEAPRLGTPVARAACSSSCAFILAAGTRRVVGVRAFVGVHDVKTWQVTRSIIREYVARRDASGQITRELVSERTVARERLVVTTNENTYRKIDAYMAEMGITPGFLPIMRSAPNTSIHWMKPAELRETHLVTEVIDADKVIEGSRIAPAQPTAAAAEVIKAPAGTGGATTALSGESSASGTLTRGP